MTPYSIHMLVHAAENVQRGVSDCLGADYMADIIDLANSHAELREALKGFMALDRTFSTVCDKHLDELAEESELGRVVKAARAALSKAGSTT